jgi:hypothetical protein
VAFIVKETWAAVGPVYFSLSARFDRVLLEFSKLLYLGEAISAKFVAVAIPVGFFAEWARFFGLRDEFYFMPFRADRDPYLSSVYVFDFVAVVLAVAG